MLTVAEVPCVEVEREVLEDQIFVSGCMSVFTAEIVGYKTVQLHRNTHPSLFLHHSPPLPCPVPRFLCTDWPHQHCCGASPVDHPQRRPHRACIQGLHPGAGERPGVQGLKGEGSRARVVQGGSRARVYGLHPGADEGTGLGILKGEGQLMDLHSAPYLTHNGSHTQPPSALSPPFHRAPTTSSWPCLMAATSALWRLRWAALLLPRAACSLRPTWLGRTGQARLSKQGSTFGVPRGRGQPGKVPPAWLR